MFANITRFGAAGQLALYAAAGDAVVEECTKARRAGLPPASIIAAMTAKIIEVGPSKVSLHCADPSKLNVLDIAPSSIVDPAAFLDAIREAKSAGGCKLSKSTGERDQDANQSSHCYDSWCNQDHKDDRKAPVSQENRQTRDGTKSRCSIPNVRKCALGGARRIQNLSVDRDCPRWQ
jgi:hypothetical protein